MRGLPLNAERVFRRAVASTAIVLLASATFVSIEGPARAADLEKVTLRLDWTPVGSHAPLFYGVARGYYRDEGIDLQIFDGKGSQATLTAVAEGTDTIGIASLATMTLGVAKGMPVVAIGGLFQSMPDGIISLKSENITKPKDLEGKSLGYNPDDYGPRIFPAFAAANGIDESKIKKVQLSWSVINTALLQGQVDFMVGWFTTELELAKQKPLAPMLKYVDYGVNMYGGGFIVSKKTASDPKEAKMLRGFLAATAKAYGELAKESVAATDALMAARPASDHDLMLQEAQVTLPLLHTKNSEGHGFGWMAKEDWAQTLQLLTKYFDLAPGTDASTLYTNEFLPKS